MVRKLKMWKALLITLLSGLVTAFLGLIHSGKSSSANDLAGPFPDLDPKKISDAHWPPPPVPGDTDGDLILDTEEAALGLLNPYDPDQNTNRVIDGPELAYQFERIIDNLPEWKQGDPAPTEIVKIDHSQWGIENCEVCGAEVNMGFLRIYNPWKEIYHDVHHIAMHYLHHGSFAFDGTINDGRIEVDLLNTVLDDDHQVDVAGDSDGDLLSDSEETALGRDPLNADESGNLRADGEDLALRFADKIDKLPLGPLPDEVYKEECIAYGVEFCEICGKEYNMGYLEITDPIKGLSVEIPFVGVHSMEHGSFSFDGTTNEGRADVTTLHEILKDV